MKCIVTRQSATWLRQADLISALDETHALLQANPHECRQNLPWLLWNVLLTTAYVQSHYKCMFLVARDLYEMFVLYRGKHATRSSTVGIWNELRVYRALVHEHIVGHSPFKCLENIVILCFERRFSKQNSIIRLKSNILHPQIFRLATPLSPILRLRFISENASLLALYICPTSLSC